IEGRLKIANDLLHFIPTIESALSSIRPSADAKSITIECDYRTAEDRVRGDADRLLQVVWNLLSNAVKFSPRGSQIVVALDQVGEHSVDWLLYGARRL